MHTQPSTEIHTHTHIIHRWRRGVAVGRPSVGLAIKRSRVRVSAGHYGVKTPGKFLTPRLVHDG